MPNISSKELSAIEDQLSLEQLMIKKYRQAAAIAADPQIKSKLESIAVKHQNHFNTLYKHLEG